MVELVLGPSPLPANEEALVTNVGDELDDDFGRKLRFRLRDANVPSIDLFTCTFWPLDSGRAVPDEVPGRPLPPAALAFIRLPPLREDGN